MAKSWLVDGRAIARKVRASGLPLTQQLKDCGVNRACPNCHCRIDNNDVSVDWPGLPFGVKFDPSDVELLGHLAAKCGVGHEAPHQFIDEFIPTLDAEEGICYKHPENLPGARKDGTAVHFFHQTANAYTTGRRKRRKIHNESTSTRDVRWHKTGKTKVVMHNGVCIGCKKILVLYGSAVGGSKPCKRNWVMHQYHLGADEDEREGEYVVSKIFYQPQKPQTEGTDDDRVVVQVSDPWMSRTSPRTPMTYAPEPPRPGKSVSYGTVTDDHVVQESECFEQKYVPTATDSERKDIMEIAVWEDDSQAVDLDAFDGSLFCKENIDACAPLGDSSLNRAALSGSGVDSHDGPGAVRAAGSGIADLNNLDLGTPPDFSLDDLQFSSQDSIFGWIDWL